MARALMSACSDRHVLSLERALCGTCSDWCGLCVASALIGSVWCVLWLACWLASCGTTSSTFVLMSTFTWWSMHGKSKWRPGNRWTHCQNEVMTTTGACKINYWQQKCAHYQNKGLVSDGRTAKMKVCKQVGALSKWRIDTRWVETGRRTVRMKAWKQVDELSKWRTENR